MTDVLSKKERSEVMARIRSVGNDATELRLVRLFRSAGITGWRRRQKLFGQPDFLFRKERLAVFVDGCYWHGCPAHCRMPKSNIAFWRRKIARNKKRDLLVNHSLRKSGWRVLRIWEHDLRKRPALCLRTISTALRPSPEITSKRKTTK